MERNCARAGPSELTHWVCDDCGEEREKQRVERESVLAEQEVEEARLAGMGIQDAERKACGGR
ncbi:hypothetical protein N7457_005689 [Penicillium paradoxum]|uniref:uncharacterized protein n=1 Tax=Penicillium paradoxum TaxID=176176 RepID=UPI002549805F|nr:uncharacterized protein N7457_005689 [Penicillium paradoxum]KAJ5780529.1 hypothetical protein N7457_005689 [Penicillium paradoxum]